MDVVRLLGYTSIHSFIPALVGNHSFSPWKQLYRICFSDGEMGTGVQNVPSRTLSVPLYVPHTHTHFSKFMVFSLDDRALCVLFGT